MKCDEIIDTALLIMGLDPERCPPATTQTRPPALRQRLEMFIPDCAASLAAQHLHSVAGLSRPFPDSAFGFTPDGIPHLEVPADFLCLATVRLSDWRTAIHETLPPGHPRRAMLSLRPAAAISPDRPAAILFPAADEDSGAMQILLFGSVTDNPRLVEARYCPRPAIATDTNGCKTLDWPQELLFSLAKAVAEHANARF